MVNLGNLRWTTGEYDWFFRGIDNVIDTQYYKETPTPTIYKKIVDCMPPERRKHLTVTFRSLLKAAHLEWQKNKDPYRWLNYTIYNRKEAERRNQEQRYPSDVHDLPKFPDWPVAFMTVIEPPVPKSPQRELPLPPPAQEDKPDKPHLVERISAMFDDARLMLLQGVDQALVDFEAQLERHYKTAPPIPAKIDEAQLEVMVTAITKARTLDEAAIRAIVRDEMNRVLKEHRQGQRLPAALPRKPKQAPSPVVVVPPPVDPITSKKKGPAQPTAKRKSVIKPPPASAPMVVQPTEVLEQAFKDKMASPEIRPEDIPSFFIFGLDTGSYETLSKTFPPNVKVDWAEKDNASARARAKASDYALISRFAGHSVMKAMRRALGNNRAYFVQGGGSSMLRYMADVSERHIKAAIKRRADAEKK